MHIDLYSIESLCFDFSIEQCSIGRSRARNILIYTVNIQRTKYPIVLQKDHKPNFANKPTCRLINPTKSEIGRISKKILDRINIKITTASKFNHWKNTASVIKFYWRKYGASLITMGYGPSKPTKRPSTSWTSLSTWAKAPTRPSQSLTPHYNTSTATATTQQWPQRTYPPASTNDCHPFHPTKHPLTKPPFHIKKHSTNTDIGTLCSTNHLQLNSSKHIDDTADNFKDSKLTTSDRGTYAHLTETASNHHWLSSHRHT